MKFITNKIKCSGICGVEVLEEVAWSAAVRDILCDGFLLQLLSGCSREGAKNSREDKGDRD